MNKALIFRNLGFTYDSSCKPLFEGLNVHFPIGWTGVIGPNGAGNYVKLLLM